MRTRNPTKIGPRRTKVLSRGACQWLLHGVLIAALTSAQSAETPSPAASGAYAGDANKFLIVDCLLPGQVRKLGARATYITARRPVKASISDCEIRGGEYVAFDRGNYNTALNFWLPQAEKGDKEAQTYVGEIFERGLTGSRDYTAAANWYKKASDQGYSRALINLGSLYEQGHGVEKDPVAALNLYRKASGLGGLIALDDGGEGISPKAEERIQSLRKELEETRQQLEDARKALQKEQTEKRSELESLKAQLQQAVDAGQLETVKQLESQVQQRQTQIEKQGQEVARLERLVEAYKNQLSRAQEQQRSLQEQLSLLQQELGSTNKELADRRKVSESSQRALAALHKELDRARSAESSGQDQEKISRLDLQLRQREQELARQSSEVALLEKQARTYQDQLAQLQQVRESEKQRAEEDRRQLRQQIAKLEGELANKNTELALRRGEAAQAVSALQESKSTIERLQKSASTSQDKETINRLRSELEHRELEVTRRAQEIAKLENDAKAYQERVNNIQAEHAAERKRAEAQFRELQLQLAKAQGDLVLSNKELERRKAESMEAQRGLESTRAELERARKTASSQLDQETIKWLQTQVEQKQREVTRQATEIAILEKQARSYQDQFAQLQAAREAERRRGEDERAQLRQQLSRTEGQLAAKDRELEQRKADLLEGQRVIEIGKAEIEKLQKPANTSAQDREALKRLQAQLEQKQQEVARQSRELGKAEQDAKSYQSQLARLQSERDLDRTRSDAERKSMQQQLAKLQQDLTAASRDLDRRKADVTESQRAMDNARAEIESLRKRTMTAEAQESVKKLEAQLRQKEDEYSKRLQEISALEQLTQNQEVQIVQLRIARQDEVRQLHLNLSRAQGELSAVQLELDRRKSDAVESQRNVAVLRADLDKARKDGGTKALDKIRDIEAKLKQREDELARQAKDVVRLDAEAKAAQAQVAKIQSNREAEQRAAESERKDLQQQVAQAQSQIASLNKDLDKRRTDSSESERSLQSALNELDRLKKGTASSSKDSQEKIQMIEARFAQREQELSRQSKEVARLEREAKAYQDRLGRLLAVQEGDRMKVEDLQRQLAQSEGQLSATTTELDRRKSEAGETQRILDLAKLEIANLSKRVESIPNPEVIARMQAQLKERELELSRQRQEIARLEGASREHAERLAKLKPAQKGGKGPKPVTVAMAPPTIHLIDPPVVVVRSPIEIKVRGGVATRDVVGKVTAPAGLLTFTVNDRPVQTDENGLFKAHVPVSKGGTPVTLVAIDQQGKRASLDFSLVPEETATTAKSVIKANTAGLETGDYYAIVIGNREYKQLVKLDTAVEDAKGVTEILAKRYKFKVTTLINATRYQILSELNKARGKLTEKDNLLIYYAGHGELDKANLRAHWLPIDAEPNSDANWISSVAITDILNAMSAKHVLVVADSCYSGAMTRAAIGQIEAGMSNDARMKWLNAIAHAKSRTVLTSGGVQPVLDGGGGKHSVFAKIFLDVLSQNDDVLEGQRLFREVSARVLDLAQRTGKFDQRPEYAPLKFAGHESGDFLFLPVN